MTAQIPARKVWLTKCFICGADGWNLERVGVKKFHRECAIALYGEDYVPRIPQGPRIVKIPKKPKNST